MAGYSPEGSLEYTDVHKFTLDNNRVTKYEEIYDSESWSGTNDIIYDGDRYWKTVTSYSYLGMTFSMTGEILWTGNNLSESITYITADDVRTRAILTPSSLTADPLSRCLFGLGMYNEFGIVFYKNYGELPENLISSVQTIYYNEGGYIVNKTYTYEFDSDGYVTKAVLDDTDEGVYTYTLVWEANTAAVDKVRSVSSEPQDFYDLKGGKHQQPAHGLNIVRMSDGTIRKVVVR